MPKFHKIIIDPENKSLTNISLLPEVLKLVLRYKNHIFDDYFLESNPSIVDAVISLIKRVSPYFWAVSDNKGAFAGFVYLDDWQGSSTRSHCATITTCMSHKFRGKFTFFAGKRFIKYVFKKYKLVKLKAEVYSNNRNAVILLKKLGFQKECTLKSETIVSSKPTDIDIYTIIKHPNSPTTR